MVRHRGDNLSLAPFTEFLIKLVADGFAFAPNACIRSIWNALDLIMLIVNVTPALIEKMLSTFFSR